MPMPRSFVRLAPAFAAAATLAGAMPAASADAQSRGRYDPRDRYEYHREDPNRPLIGIGGGFDSRNVDDSDVRYVLQAGVDFRGRRTGLGIRPEVLYSWRDSDVNGLAPSCPNCSSVSPFTFSQRGRSFGVNVNATYRFGGEGVRPYLLSGIGVFSTRYSANGVAMFAPGTTTIQPGGQFLQQNVATTDVSVGLNGGAGLEFKIAAIRLFAEYRYFLADPSTGGGSFSGMLPITAGIRF
jgi:hypothetical protein